MKEKLFKKLPIIIYESIVKIKDESVEILSIDLLDSNYIEALTGYTKEELSSPNLWFSKIHEEDKPTVLKKLSLLETSESTSFTYRFLTKNGSYLYLKNNVYITEKNDNVYKNIGFVENLTDLFDLQVQSQESLELFKVLSIKSPVGIYMLGKDSYIYANQKTLDILGYTFDEIKHIKPIDLFYNEKERVKINEILQRRFRGEKFSINYSEIKMLKKDKSIIYANLFANTIKYKNEYVAFGVIIDITEQKLIEKLYFALKEINRLITLENSEDKLLMSICRILVEKLDFGLVSVGYIDAAKNFVVKYANAQNEAILSDFKTLKISTDINTDFGLGVVSRAFNSGAISIVSNVKKDSGLHFWSSYFKKHSILSACAIPILLYGKVQYVILLHSKIANQFREKYLDILKEIQSDISFALQKIKDEQHRVMLDEAIWSSSEWVVITGADGTIEYANKTVSDISGYEAQELIGKKPSVFKSGYHSNDFYKNLWDNLLSGKSYNCSFINKNKNGKLFYLSSLIIPVKINDKVSRFVDLARDITKETKHLQTIENLSSIYATLSEINQLLIYETNEEVIFDKITKILVEYAKFKIAYVALVNYDNDFYIKASNIENPSYKSFLDFVSKQFSILKTLDKDKLYSFPFFKSFKNKRVYIINDASTKALGPFNAEAAKIGIHSCCFLPIIKNSKSIGVIVALSDKINFFNKSIFDLLKEITLDINYALDNLENQRWRNIVMLAIDKNENLIGVMDKDFNIVYVNEAVEKITGFKKDEVIGKHHSIFSSKTHSREFAKNFYNTLKSGKIFSDIITYKTKNETFFNALVSIVPFIEDNQIKYYVIIAKDISREKSLYEKINYLTNFDMTTGLPNRQAFLDYIERFLKRAEIENKIGAVVVINPINFGNINKAYGFELGNQILQAIAKRLGKTVRQIDIVAKLESDKFAVLLKDLSFEEDSLVLMVNIIRVLSDDYNINGNTVKLSFNAGVSLYPKDSKSSKTLLEKAEIAVVDAKEKGEGALGFYRQEVEASAKERLDLRYNLTKAITNREFLVYYQPYFEVKSKKIIGAESLLRWKKDNKIIPPLEFIPFLEETGLILNVEDWIKNEVARDISLRKHKIPISINISPISFKQRHFVNEIVSIIQANLIDPSLIIIEMVERTFVENLPYYKVLFNELKSHNIKLSLDDFGTGYSSLSYLSELPFDYIKIDISFVKKMLFDLKAKSIVETIIYLAHNLGIKTIAEGVETTEQLSMLEQLGCDAVQGFLLSMPLTKEEFDHLIGD
ncbi:diguanylate cyclase/phosphodiesterase (GGDEF / EAL domains) with PAS/PAC sensor(s) [Desulfurella amilsii]|uniref:Diguanylate cyclase/phosphodiesterase (GGDEF / EAL domains) with PAS/PAC sensor(S) n=1 Tax=Desulfurella amilsii TaxID=1562698 RepID=A0A1X4XXB0_9BACT|nr:EAL domain-containing protein [Desulfurella amilsii]OSS42166.1 diguanylate cyclase/phosphodiesterase (GGDEF / EAL domains) with PAS/PAC sensor(s) [Desulfurella amilsii]